MGVIDRNVEQFVRWKDWRIAFWLAIFIYANALAVIEYSFAELLHPPDKPGEIFDLGFKLTQQIHDFLAREAFWNDFFAGANTVFSMFMGLYPFYVALFKDQIGSLLAGLVVFGARSLCGLLTTMPVHREYLPSAADWPNCVWGAGAPGHALLPAGFFSAKDTGFFTFFSGHVAVPMLLVVKLGREGRGTLVRLVHLGNLLQIVRLLATRGHWSIDMFIGSLLGYWSAGLAKRLDDAAAKGLRGRAKAA